MLAAVPDSALAVSVEDADVASLTTSSGLARVTISSASDAFVTATDGVDQVSFGYSQSLSAFALGGGSSLHDDVWMSIQGGDGSGTLYSEARFSGHVSVRNPTPLLSLYNTDTGLHVLQLSPYTVHLGKPDGPAGTVDISNVGHALRLSIDESAVVYVTQSGLSVSTVFTDTVTVGDSRVLIGSSPRDDIIFSRSTHLSSNIGTHRTWNTYDGAALMHQGDIVVSCRPDAATGLLEFDFSASINNLGPGVSFILRARPSFLLHHRLASINTRNTTSVAAEW